MHCVELVSFVAIICVIAVPSVVVFIVGNAHDDEDKLGIYLKVMSVHRRLWMLSEYYYTANNAYNLCLDRVLVRVFRNLSTASVGSSIRRSNLAL